ncbi:MurR/RpiR family transcriptional regulator [Streptomyces griseosporeus]|uniref:MurR/RpiR family transcriptional regulator n=1 Tax=Streptomyces griseosporeus TaxID=1910 RepID=UPI003702F494
MVPSPIADDIRRELGVLAPAERMVAGILLAPYPSAGFETVATIAERAGVSAPTVLRFVTRLGYTGFPDFQAALRKELDERSASLTALALRDRRQRNLRTLHRPPLGAQQHPPHPGPLPDTHRHPVA